MYHTSPLNRRKGRYRCRHLSWCCNALPKENAHPPRMHACDATQNKLCRPAPPAPTSSHTSPPGSTQPEAVAAAAADTFRQAPGATSRATGPSGLGLSLPSRPSSSRPDSKPQIHAGKATAEGLAFDPLRRGTARPSPKQQQQQQQQSNAQGRQLPPDVQRLADDLVRLVSETNIGEDRTFLILGPAGWADRVPCALLGLCS